MCGLSATYMCIILVIGTDGLDFHSCIAHKGGRTCVTSAADDAYWMCCLELLLLSRSSNPDPKAPEACLVIKSATWLAHSQVQNGH